MPDYVVEGLGLLGEGLEIVGAGALVIGFVVATLHWLLATRRQGRVEAVEGYRRALGRSILIGLEILVAATIIKTITLEPTMEGISFLAIMVIIRTVLGWTTVLEMNGRWPWQKPRPGAAKP